MGGAAEQVGPTTLIIAADRAREARGLLEKVGFPPRASGDDDDSLDDVDDPFADDDEVDDGNDGGDDELGAPPIAGDVAHPDHAGGDRVALALGLTLEGA